jgi:hypothetical protein
MICRQNKFTLIFLLLIVFSIFSLWGCGNGSSSSDDPGPDTGALRFSVVFHGAGDHSLRAAVIDCAGYGIATVEADVYDADNAFLVGGGPWNCEAGQGTITSAPTGSDRTVVVLGKNADGHVGFRGQKTGIEIVAGTNNDAGTIDCHAFVTSLQVPADGAVINADTMGLAWNAVAGATQYRILISEDGNFTDPLINDIIITTNYTPLDLSDTKTYYWQVIALDAYDNRGVGSQIRSFTIDAEHVNSTPVAQITSPAQGNSYTVGDTITFTGSGNDNEDGDLSGASLVWHSDVDGQIGTGETLTSGMLSAGTHNIALSAIDSEGATGTDTVTITVNTSPSNTPPPARINSPDDGSTYTVGNAITFAGTGSDDEDGDLSGASLVWRSDVDGQIGTGKTFALDALSAGTHQITLTATDSEDDTGMDTVVITIAASRLPDTGQTLSYTSTFGEDSDYLINPPAYTKLDEFGRDLDADAAPWAMVRDDVTGLIWEVKTNDTGIHDKDTKFTWQACQDSFIAQLNSSQFGEHSDWRLPTIKELATLTHKDKFSPAINKNYFPNTIPDDYEASAYWSSTQSVSSGNAWSVHFDSGVVRLHDQSSQFYVRAVRGEQPIGNLVDNGDGTVTDTITGLMWQQAEAGAMTWAEALAYCESLILAGYGDWRLPNANELHSLINYEINKPSIDRRIFPGALSTTYWTSTTFASSTEMGWDVDFNFGNVDRMYKSLAENVRAVRGWQ